MDRLYYHGHLSKSIESKSQCSFSQPLESIVSIVSIYLVLEWLGQFLHSSSDPKKRESCKERLKKKFSLKF